MKLAFLAPVSHSNALRLAVVRGVGSVILSPTAYASTGDPVAAWRFADDQHCALFVFWVAAGAAGIVLSPTDAVRSATGIMQTVMVGSPAQLLAGQGERYDLLLNLTNMNGVDHMSFSDTIVAADGQPGGRLYVAKRPGGTFEEIPKQAGKNWDDHAIVGSEVLATASDDLGSLYVRHPDGSVVLLKDDPTRSVGLIAADTNFMAWQEGSGGTVWTGYTRVEVWAAPFTTDPSSFHPYKAADIPNNGLYDFAFGEGWYIVRLEAGGVRFVHLGDAKYVDIAPPPGLAFIRAVNVAAGEAWFLMRTSPGIENPVTVARYDLSAVLANLP